MKILYPHDDPWNATNPYIRTLIDGLKKAYSDFEYGFNTETFWTDALFDYDIVHIMWPQGLLLGRYTSAEVESRLLEYKKQGGIIVSTCHNLVPHYDSDEECNRSYEIVYRNSDCIFHLGEYSLNLFKKKYNASKNILLYHHVYDSIYPDIPSKNVARHILNLKAGYRFILCLGAFRSEAERNLIMELSKRLRKDKIVILAPSFIFVPKRKNVFKIFRPLIRYFYYSIFYPNIKKRIGIIPDSLIPYYCCACDLVLIQRVEVLNSGNLPLGFYFGKIVVGPNIGNVGYILSKRHNPVFDIMDVRGSLPKAVLGGLELAGTNLGMENRSWIIKHCSTAEICRKLYCQYTLLLNK